MAKKELDISGWSPEDQQMYHKLVRDVQYYDQCQYIFKIKLNSLYGALLNKHFRFYDERLGESTTGTGRAILRFQCSKVNEVLTGVYDPLGDAVLYGDTDSTYFSAMYGVDMSTLTLDEKIDQAIIRADDVSDQVNAAYPQFMKDSFLCNDEYSGMVKCAREVVAPSGIFVTPKRYVLWLADLDGKRVDKLKVMGLDTKKTILPKYVQDALNGFIERYLKFEEWDIIAKDVVEFKNQVLKRPISDLGLPKGVNKVEYYMSELEHLGDKARLPGHVRAAIYYNMKRAEFGDTQSMIIQSGMKIKVFYLKRPDGKFKSIALPVDEDIVPEWFSKMNIDVDLQIIKLVDNPLLNILKAVDKEPPTPQTLFVGTVLEF